MFSDSISLGGVIVLQDYNGMASGDVMRAVNDFMETDSRFVIDNEVALSLVLRKISINTK